MKKTKIYKKIAVFGFSALFAFSGFLVAHPSRGGGSNNNRGLSQNNNKNVVSHNNNKRVSSQKRNNKVVTFHNRGQQQVQMNNNSRIQRNNNSKKISQNRIKNKNTIFQGQQRRRNSASGVYRSNMSLKQKVQFFRNQYDKMNDVSKNSWILRNGGAFIIKDPDVSLFKGNAFVEYKSLIRYRPEMIKLMEEAVQVMCEGKFTVIKGGGQDKINKRLIKQQIIQLKMYECRSQLLAEILKTGWVKAVK